jgi:uncharacterized membrane protein YGL010W
MTFAELMLLMKGVLIGLGWGLGVVAICFILYFVANKIFGKGGER